MSVIRAPGKYENEATLHAVHCGPSGRFRQLENSFVSGYETKLASRCLGPGPAPVQDAGGVRYAWAMRAAQAAPGCWDAAVPAAPSPWSTGPAPPPDSKISTCPPPAAFARASAISALRHTCAAGAPPARAAPILAVMVRSESP